MNKTQQLADQYLSFRANPPTVASYWSRHLRGALGAYVPFAVIAGVSVYVGLYALGAVALGLLIGHVIGDLRWIRRTVSAWPLVAELIDWNRVQSLGEGREVVLITSQRLSAFRFATRDLMWFILVIALGVGWWIEYRAATKARQDAAEYREDAQGLAAASFTGTTDNEIIRLHVKYGLREPLSIADEPE